MFLKVSGKGITQSSSSTSNNRVEVEAQPSIQIQTTQTQHATPKKARTILVRTIKHENYCISLGTMQL
jgi:hypothetical protein